MAIPGLGPGVEIRTSGVKAVCSVRPGAGEGSSGRSPGRGHPPGGMEAVTDSMKGLAGAGVGVLRRSRGGRMVWCSSAWSPGAGAGNGEDADCPVPPREPQGGEEGVLPSERLGGRAASR